MAEAFEHLYKGTKKSMKVPSRWKVVLAYTNDLSEPIPLSIKWTRGSRTLSSDHKSITATVETELTTGIKFQILDMGTEITTKVEENVQTQTISMSQSEIYNSSEFSTTVEVQPHSRFVRLQLVSDVAGHEIGYDYLIDTTVEQCTHSLNSACTVLIPREVSLQTPFRLMHKEKQKYVTIVKRKGWPAATLGASNLYHFQLFEVSNGIYKIKALNTPYLGYDVMYSAEAGGIYFDQWSGNEKQLWTMSKARPFYEGDIVTFKNIYWTQAGLCHHEGEHTDVYCMERKEDDWIMELID